MGDKGIPIPPHSGGKLGARRDPDSITGKIRALGLQESFFLPDRDTTEASRFVYKARKLRRKAKYVCRTVEGGVRIWCVALPADELDAAELDLFS